MADTTLRADTARSVPPAKTSVRRTEFRTLLAASDMTRGGRGGFGAAGADSRNGIGLAKRPAAV